MNWVPAYTLSWYIQAHLPSLYYCYCFSSGEDKPFLFVLLPGDLLLCTLFMAFMLLIRLLGLMSVQCLFINSRQAERLSDLWMILQPSGTSMNDGHNECCPSSLTRTWYTPLSSSNGFGTC